MMWSTRILQQQQQLSRVNVAFPTYRQRKRNPERLRNLAKVTGLTSAGASLVVGLAVKNPPLDAEDASLIPGLGGPHKLWSQ